MAIRKIVCVNIGDGDELHQLVSPALRSPLPRSLSPYPVECYDDRLTNLHVLFITIVASITYTVFFSPGNEVGKWIERVDKFTSITVSR